MPIAKHRARLTGDTTVEARKDDKLFPAPPVVEENGNRRNIFSLRFDVAQSLSDCFSCISFASERYFQPVPCLKSILHSQHIFLYVFCSFSTRISFLHARKPSERCFETLDCRPSGETRAGVQSRSSQLVSEVNASLIQVEMFRYSRNFTF